MADRVRYAFQAARPIAAQPVNLTTKIREIIEGGPPEDLVHNFHSLFSEKIEATHKLARDAAKQHALLEDLI